MKPPIKENGIELLKEVALQAENTTSFVFHGSHRKHAKLEPQLVYWKDPKGKLYPDSEGSVVCASDKPCISKLMTKPMSRKEFLTTVGFGAASVAGFGGLLKLLGHDKHFASTSRLGYGSGAYSGTTTRQARSPRNTRSI